MSDKKRHHKKGKETDDTFRKDKLPEVQQRFSYLFEIYDNESLGTIAEEDFPLFIRALGLCPTNAKINELSTMCRENEGDKFFANSKIEEVMTPIVLDVILNPNHELAPPSDEVLELALKSLDAEHKGHLTEGDFRTILANNGEKLDPDEIEPALDEAINPATGVIDLGRYAGKMLQNSKLSYKPKQQNVSAQPVDGQTNPGDTIAPDSPHVFSNLTEPST